MAKQAFDTAALVAAAAVLVLFPQNPTIWPSIAKAICLAAPQVPGLVISAGQGNDLETVLRAVGLAATFAAGIGGIISKGSSSFKTIANAYGDDVAKAISEYGDDIARIEQNYGKGVAGKTSKFFSDADDYILKHPLDIDVPRVKTSVTSGMSAEETEAYLKFLENGSTAGLTPEELAGVQKVQKQRALNKVDYNDIYKMRAVSGNGSTSVQHAVGNVKQAQSVLDGIDPQYFNSKSRFGGGFYVGADADIIIAELAYHGNTAKYAISYDINLTGQKVLDLTNPQVASEWNYVQNVSSAKACQTIGQAATAQGYDVIKFQSFRGNGINYVIYDNFESILNPRIVTPVE